MVEEGSKSRSSGGVFFSCPDESLRQLYTYPCHSLTHNLLLFYIKEPQVTFEKFDQSDEETWPDQKEDNGKDKDNHKDNDKDNDKDKYN